MTASPNRFHEETELILLKGQVRLTRGTGTEEMIRIDRDGVCLTPSAPGASIIEYIIILYHPQKIILSTRMKHSNAVLSANGAPIIKYIILHYFIQEHFYNWSET